MDFWTWLSASLLACAMMASPALAHTRSESHTTWTIDGRIVRMNITAPDMEMARIDNGKRPADRQILTYLTPRIGVLSGKNACLVAAPPRVVLAATGFRRAEFAFDCPTDADMHLRFEGFFDLISTHIDLAQIQFNNGDFVEQLFSNDAQEIDVTRSRGGELAGASFFRFVQMGIMHIFTGVDHMSFLLGLVLISRRLRDLIFVVTGFTIGHSLTLGLAVTGLIRPHAEFIDALVALTIALIGVENLVVTLKRPDKLAIISGFVLLLMGFLRLAGIGVLPPLLLIGGALFTTCYLMISGHLHDTGRLRMVVTTVFGLIHGFGFAADLLESRLPREKLAEILVGFNLGVEMAQLTVVLMVTGGVLTARRLRIATPRAITVDTLASALVAIGMFWFIVRSLA
ncbi:HupE/UreJ family protein [Novosphingobium rosa]|uniref:HupE/UreJ family protein n=1 Tax=Novosphingobium rosa TaxID=76978 RepID=UPI0012EEAD3B|nr:HupE/UreJ family protein [Novosphingobium rosa]